MTDVFLWINEISSKGKVCSCCQVRLPDALYRLNKKTGQRSFRRCIDCDRECRKGGCVMGEFDE